MIRPFFVTLTGLFFGFHFIALYQNPVSVFGFLIMLSMSAIMFLQGKTRSIIYFFIFLIPLIVSIFIASEEQRTIHLGYVIFLLAWCFSEKFHYIQILSKYVPKGLADALVFNDDSKLEGEFKEVTIMFCDIENFTSLSEKVEPQELVAMLNYYFSAMSEVLEKYDATIDKYIGDSIMAFWNAPNYQADHADRAIDAARDMQEALTNLNSHFSQLNYPAISMGIGIHTGKVAVGLMGSNQRLSYTAVGESVNTCARLEALTRKYNSTLIVSEATSFASLKYGFKYLDQVTVRGSHCNTRIYIPTTQDDSDLLTPVRSLNHLGTTTEATH